MTTTADRRGRFELEDVHLELGTDDYFIMLTDRVGNTATSTIEATRLANSAVHWNDIALEAIKDTSTAPMYATRLLVMESVAVYDVLNAIEHDPLSWSTSIGPCALGSTQRPPSRRRPTSCS